VFAHTADIQEKGKIMNLYIFIMVEPRDKIPAGAKAGDEFTLMLGGIPAGETKGPWQEDQKEVIHAAITNWYKEKPANATAIHLTQRKAVLDDLENDNYYFTFEFSTGDEISLDALSTDTSRLYLLLQEACQDTDMVVTKFDSI
jgi:hypothetical protein